MYNEQENERYWKEQQQNQQKTEQFWRQQPIIIEKKQNSIATVLVAIAAILVIVYLLPKVILEYQILSNIDFFDLLEDIKYYLNIKL